MLVLIKGAGDLATGVAHRLYGVGVSVVMTELEAPTAVRRGVAFSQCIYDGVAEVEGVTAGRKGYRRSRRSWGGEMSPCWPIRRRQSGTSCPLQR